MLILNWIINLKNQNKHTNFYFILVKLNIYSQSFQINRLDFVDLCGSCNFVRFLGFGAQLHGS